MPTKLKRIFNYSQVKITVHNTQTGRKWEVDPSTNQDGYDDSIPWDTHGVLRITTANNQVWDAIDRGGKVRLKIPGEGEKEAANIPNVYAEYNLDFFDGGPNFTFL